MKQHEIFKSFEVVQWVGETVVELGLRHLKLRWDGFLHDFRGEGQSRIEVVLVGTL